MVRFEATLDDGELRLLPFRPSDRATVHTSRDAAMDRSVGPPSSEMSPVASVRVGADMVGWIDFDADRPWLKERQVNVGYAIFPAHRGKHYATRALRLLVGFLEDRDPPLAPTVLIHPKNLASLAVAAGAGFDNVGPVDGQLLLARPHRPRLVDAIYAALSGDPTSAPVTRTIHGSDDPAEIAANLRKVLETTGLQILDGRCRFHTASVGTVTALQITNGADVVVKVYQPTWSPTFLAGVVDIQSRLADGGVPCPIPIAGPVPCGTGQATVESYLADPDHPVEFGDRERRASARGFAEVIEIAGLDDRLEDHPLLQRRADSLYPDPHSPIFDFDSTSEGADWIDALAKLARANMDDKPTVVAHTDWSARNVRLTPDGIVAVYDWDSLACTSLPTALGQAAATWRALGEADEPEAPNIDEINAWIDDCPTSISRVGRKAALAAALWTLAYTARCEHSIDPRENIHHRARPRLRTDADRFRRELL